MTESERSGERLLQAARRVSAANQFAGYTGGLWEWPCDKDEHRLIGGSASSPDPNFSRNWFRPKQSSSFREVEEVLPERGEVFPLAFLLGLFLRG